MWTRGFALPAVRALGREAVAVRTTTRQPTSSCGRVPDTTARPVDSERSAGQPRRETCRSLRPPLRARRPRSGQQGAQVGDGTRPELRPERMHPGSSPPDPGGRNTTTGVAVLTETLAAPGPSGWVSAVTATAVNGVVVGYGVVWFQLFGDRRCRGLPGLRGRLGAAAVILRWRCPDPDPPGPRWLAWATGMAAAILGLLAASSMRSVHAGESRCIAPTSTGWDGVGAG